MTRRLSLSHPTSTGSTTRRCKLKPTHLDTSTRNDEKTVKALAMHTSQGKHSPSSRPRLASTPLDTSNISIVLQKGGDTYLAPRHLARPTSLQGGNGELLKYTTRRGKGKPTDLDGSTRNNEHAVKALGMTTSLWEHSPESPPRLASTPPATSINTVFNTPQCDPHSPAPPPHDVLSAVSLYINRDSTTRRGKENPTYGDTNTRHNEHTICNKSISSAHKPVATLTSEQAPTRVYTTSHVDHQHGPSKGGNTYLAPRHLARPTSLQGGNGELLEYMVSTILTVANIDLPACSTTRPDAPQHQNLRVECSTVNRRAQGESRLP
uniref:Uncharacterized protein n=1 Tax=Psilocybe cubensis TaxID=181762 RepID=A0A8H7XKW0_PSICU